IVKIPLTAMGTAIPHPHDCRGGDCGLIPAVCSIMPGYLQSQTKDTLARSFNMASAPSENQFNIHGRQCLNFCHIQGMTYKELHKLRCRLAAMVHYVECRARMQE